MYKKFFRYNVAPKRIDYNILTTGVCPFVLLHVPFLRKCLPTKITGVWLVAAMDSDMGLQVGLGSEALPTELTAHLPGVILFEVNLPLMAPQGRGSLQGFLAVRALELRRVRVLAEKVAGVEVFRGVEAIADCTPELEEKKVSLIFGQLGSD